MYWKTKFSILRIKTTQTPSFPDWWNVYEALGGFGPWAHENALGPLTEFPMAGIARHRGFASLTHSKSQSRIVVTSAAAHGRIVKTVKKVTTYMVGTVKRQNISSSERSCRKIAETRQSLFRKSAWSGYAHKMCAVDSNTKRLYSNEMSHRATHFTVFMIMNCPVEQQISAAYGSIVDDLLTFIDLIRKAHKNA